MGILFWILFFFSIPGLVLQWLVQLLLNKLRINYDYESTGLILIALVGSFGFWIALSFILVLL